LHADEVIVDLTDENAGAGGGGRKSKKKSDGGVGIGVGGSMGAGVMGDIIAIDD
jgi:hypothetical protein